MKESVTKPIKIPNLGYQNINIMSVSELKLEIINKVTSISDEQILEDIIRLINQESILAQTYKLTQEERNAVQKGLQDVADGNLHSSESAKNMLEEWLKK
jgi:predicted AAA+ superfamily ATPase